MIREKNHQTSKVWAFWAVQLAAQTKSIYVEKNVAQSIKYTIGILQKNVSILKIRGCPQTGY